MTEKTEKTEKAAAPHWFRSNHSGSGGGNCVEAAAGLDVVCVRDSRAADGGPVPRVGRGERAAFVALAAEQPAPTWMPGRNNRLIRVTRGEVVPVSLAEIAQIAGMGHSRQQLAPAPRLVPDPDRWHRRQSAVLPRRGGGVAAEERRAHGHRRT
ncbi:DUF397 domain-containing protein [Streptomyces sp. B3I8]|uniref:DUF397 domain-containing protein n=1 Tax=Streptomyces sp. B3I8 TaxID=3042303 RepID=UPI0027880B06|nr:DUF397 domain-containing protein [Streptomyces sp. B3I8]MDQ0785706.1 hypothetical protein [Streptomyces sp. B3I8]